MLFFTNSTSILGESLTISCFANLRHFNKYHSTVTVSIVANGRSIANGTDFWDGMNFTSSIDSLRVSDAGEYQCIISITQYGMNYQYNERLELTLTSTFSHIDYVYYNSFV